MKRLALSALFMLIVSPVWATTYYLAPASVGGNDSNTGTSASAPWLTPNHPVNCGDVISAAASASYSNQNFQTGHWGKVSCTGGNNVAWLKCSTFDACKITANDSFSGMWVDQSYWGVQGWEVTTVSGLYAICFMAVPNYNNPAQIHHIIFANNVANGCEGGGFNSANYGSVSGDYLAFVGNIAYNTAHGNGACDSAFSAYEPAQSDNLPGTHIYISGNFTWKNFDGDPCNNGGPTDGEGVILDTLSALGYAAQVVVQNNIVFLNGGKGIQTYLNSSAKIYIRSNTIYGNNGDTNQNYTNCGDLNISNSSLVDESYNLVATNSASGCGGNLIYAVSVLSGDGTDSVYNNFAFGANGQNSIASASGTFAFGPNNTLGTNPGFANPVNPGAPNCGSASNVPNCMGAVISNFIPTTAAAKGYGYQVPTAPQTSDPLFPQWLCNVNLPAGLVTMGCVSASSVPAPPTIITVTVK